MFYNSQAKMFFGSLNECIQKKVMIDFNKSSIENALSYYAKGTVRAFSDKLEDEFDTLSNRLESVEYISENTIEEANLVYDEDCHRSYSEPAEMTDEYYELENYKSKIYQIFLITNEYFNDNFAD